MHIYNRYQLPDSIDWKQYRKLLFTRAVRIDGPFIVNTLEGKLQCSDGYLAMDAHGWPYPITKEEFETIYEEVTSTDA